MAKFTEILGYVLMAISVISPILYFIGFTRNSKAYKIFTFYLSYIALIQIALFVYLINDEKSIFLFHFYFLGQFIFLSLFYKRLINSKWVYFLLIFGLLFLGFTYWDNPSIIEGYHTFGAVFAHSVIVVLAMIYYYRSLSVKGNFLYVNTGVLIYFLSSILYYASGNLVLKLGLERETQRYISLVNDFLYVLFSVLIFIEWYKNYRPKKTA